MMKRFKLLFNGACVLHLQVANVMKLRTVSLVQLCCAPGCTLQHKVIFDRLGLSRLSSGNTKSSQPMGSCYHVHLPTTPAHSKTQGHMNHRGDFSSTFNPIGEKIDIDYIGVIQK